VLLNERLLLFELDAQIVEIGLLVLCLVQGNVKQLLVPLLSFYKTPQLVGAVNKSLALVLDFLDGLLVFLLYLHKFFEFLLEPLQLLFK